MKRSLTIISLLLFICLCAMAGDKMPKYDITGAGSGTEGTVLVKVYVYARSVKDEDLKRACCPWHYLQRMFWKCQRCSSASHGITDRRDRQCRFL